MKKNNNIAVHHTEINQVENGWEYKCKTCGYQARYTNKDGKQRLEIVNVGEVKHTIEQLSDQITHLENQVEEILKRHFQEFGEI